MKIGPGPSVASGFVVPWAMLLFTWLKLTTRAMRWCVGDAAASPGHGVVIDLAGVQDQRAAMVEDAGRAGRGVVRGKYLSLNPLTW